MDDDLRAIERLLALAERTARIDADGWWREPTPRRAVRVHLAAALTALAARLDPAPARRRDDMPRAPATAG